QREPARPRSLDPRIDRDLETICLKCLEREPARRYGSAEGLADDLGRWARGEPIVARPTSARERLAKWARRRPAIASLSAAVLAVAALGLAGVIWKWREAEANAALARTNEIETQKANDALQVALGENERERLKVEEANKKLYFSLEELRIGTYI